MRKGLSPAPGFFEVLEIERIEPHTDEDLRISWLEVPYAL